MLLLLVVKNMWLVKFPSSLLAVVMDILLLCGSHCGSDGTVIITVNTMVLVCRGCPTLKWCVDNDAGCVILDTVVFLFRCSCWPSQWSWLSGCCNNTLTHSHNRSAMNKYISCDLCLFVVWSITFVRCTDLSVVGLFDNDNTWTVWLVMNTAQCVEFCWFLMPRFSVYVVWFFLKFHLQTLNFLRHDIAATCVLKMPLNPNQPTNHLDLHAVCRLHWDQ